MGSEMCIRDSRKISFITNSLIFRFSTFTFVSSQIYALRYVPFRSFQTHLGLFCGKQWAPLPVSSCFVAVIVVHDCTSSDLYAVRLYDYALCQFWFETKLKSFCDSLPHATESLFRNGYSIHRIRKTQHCLSTAKNNSGQTLRKVARSHVISY